MGPQHFKIWGARDPRILKFWGPWGPKMGGPYFHMTTVLIYKLAYSVKVVRLQPYRPYQLLWPCIKLSTSPRELQKLRPTLVHIATEVLETLHPGATGLCFITKVWLVTLTDGNALASNRQHACPSELKRL